MQASEENEAQQKKAPSQPGRRGSNVFALNEPLEHSNRTGGAICTFEGLTNTKYDRIAELDQSSLLPAVTDNNQKEELCLEYIENFRAQFQQLFPDRKRPFLTAKNEAGVEKLVCTSLHPTQLPYKELYHLRPCAQFIANYLRYEPLADPTSTVKYVCSPNLILGWRVGDCFDFSTVLCSLLLGNGYDAYCVLGTAPKWITLRDTRTHECSYELPALEFEDPDKDVHDGTLFDGRYIAASEERSRGKRKNKEKQIDLSNSKYAPPPPPSTKSKYLELVEQQKQKEEDDKQEEENYESDADESDEDERETVEYLKTVFDSAHQQMASSYRRGSVSSQTFQQSGLPAPFGTPDMSYEDLEKEDPLSGERVHCWVLVRAGPRDVAEHLFVEPSTGLIYPVKDAPYYSVESIWNQKNIWINMQRQVLVPSAKVPEAPEETDKGATRVRPESSDDDVDVDNLIEAGLYDPEDPAPLKEAAEEVVNQPRLKLTEDYKIVKENTDEPVEVSHSGSVAATQNGENEKTKDNVQENEEQDSEERNNYEIEGFPTVAGLSYKLDNTDDWEFVFFPYEREAASERKEGEEEEKEQEGNEVLDPPISWAQKVSISRNDYEKRYGNTGNRTTLWRKSKLQLYAPLTHAAGLEARLLEFTDATNICLRKSTEIFTHRRDKLSKRVKHPLDGIIEEHFAPGRNEGLCSIIDEQGTRRLTKYYVDARLDGLYEREEQYGHKIMLWFRNRRDRLTYRSATLKEQIETSSNEEDGQKGVDIAFSVSNKILDTEAGTYTIRKLAEKYDRNPELEAHRNIRKMSYHLDEQTIQVSYHYASGRITANTRVYHKSSSPPGHMEMLTEDPFAPKPSQFEVEKDYRAAVAAEGDCYNGLRSAQKDAGQITSLRQQEENSIQFDYSPFEIAAEKAGAAAPLEGSEEKGQGEEGEEMDYLAPFLHGVQDSNNMTYDEAKWVRQEMRNTLAERKQERARIIQARLDEENMALQRKQREFARNRDQVEGADEEFERYCAEAMFRIGILEQRLKRQDEILAEKRVQLEQKFRQDPRLAILYGGGGQREEDQ
eukprot:gb/GECG01000509.1/.p1 GENE.gb/GECG01000509.1/~~gb/GECG01000509.1/.p1  ORF type:complete len:1062 (+),score=173.97 gb/GECG01000509.1/:1-3186(+)